MKIAARRIAAARARPLDGLLPSGQPAETPVCPLYVISLDCVGSPADGHDLCRLAAAATRPCSALAITAPYQRGRPRDRNPLRSSLYARHQSRRSRLWAAALARSRQAGGIPDRVRHGARRPHEKRALYARHRPRAPPSRHRTRRAEIRRDRLPRRQHGRLGKARGRRRRLADRGPSTSPAAASASA